MQCPKCGGEIAFYDLKPNCKHCGVNIMYYAQTDGLMRDAKRTELEAASARMVIARVKAHFIGGKLPIARIAAVAAVIAVLLIPFSGVRYTTPFFDASFSAGVIGMIASAADGLLLRLPDFLGGTLLARQTLAAVIPTASLLMLAVLDLAIFACFLLGFLNLHRSTKHLRNAALIGAVLAAATQIFVFVYRAVTPDSVCAQIRPGFGALAAAAAYLLLYFLNRALLRDPPQPQYRENDVERKAMLRRVRAGEVDLDDLPLPVFESEAEHAERLRALEEALRAEEEGKAP